VTDAVDLERISAAVHDAWFELDRVEHDAETGEVRLTVYPADRKRGQLIESGHAPREPLPRPLGELVVRNVVHLDVADDAGIGWFDVGGIALDPTTNVVRLWSHYPLEIRLTVEGIDVELLRP
jgi:hypothetical protein